jgi:hypothetical protein
MYFTLVDVLVLFALGAVALFILESTRVRELAIQAVQRASAQQDFQLLDQNVHVQRLSLSRNDKGRWGIWRQYRFDYSYDGVERRQGHVIMLGKKLQAMVVSENNSTVH